ncbi:MAG: TRAP transporter substrate-binding protein [Bacteroidaceae bacterium]|nr:TRAP transporter substrate-binding protein [Bacteroidaceae bacterium]
MLSRLTSLFITLTAMSLIGCSQPKQSTPKKTDYAWILATASPENTVTGIFANVFAEQVHERSGGAMKIKVYHNSVLGGDTELFESCQCGDIPFVVQNTAPEVSYLSQLCLFDLPCLFNGLDEVHEVLDDSVFMQEINKIYETGHVRLLAMADQHFRVMTSNRAIRSLEDLKGIKIRTMENSFHMDFWSALGANPTPMAFAELYVGLEQHTVDAQENPYEVICSNGFYEVQKYVVETNHLPHLLALVTNNDFFLRLPPDQQAVINESATFAKDFARQQALERSQSRIKEIQANGTTFVPVSEALRHAMRQQALPLFRQIRDAIGNDSLFRAYCKEIPE